jgi:hypothetical protein
MLDGSYFWTWTDEKLTLNCILQSHHFVNQLRFSLN